MCVANIKRGCNSINLFDEKTFLLICLSSYIDVHKQIQKKSTQSSAHGNQKYITQENQNS